MKNLGKELLEHVTGGAWDFDTLTPEELSEYNALEEARIDAENAGDWNTAKAMEAKINEFIDRMNSIYGV